MSSSTRSDGPHDLPLDWAPPTTPADREALRAARRASLAPADRWAVLALVELFPLPPRRSTSAGREPFRLTESDED